MTAKHLLPGDIVTLRKTKSEITKVVANDAWGFPYIHVWVYGVGSYISKPKSMPKAFKAIEREGKVIWKK